MGECDVSFYNCPDCGKKDMRADDPLLRNGRYGPNAVMEIILNYLFRITNRKNGERMALLAGVMMSAGTVNNTLKRFCGRLIPLAKVIMEHLRRAGILHIDETVIRLGRKNVWMWTFFDPKRGEVLFLIRDS